MAVYKPKVLARFHKRVEPDLNGGCWLWSGATNSSGYGHLKAGGRATLAHRMSFEIHCGAIPAGAGVCHRCDVPACVNPAHLFLGSQLDNVRDMIAKGRARHAKGEQNGRASNFLETPDGRMTLAEAAARAGINRYTVSFRLKAGWPVEKALSTPVLRYRRTG